MVDKNREVFLAFVAKMSDGNPYHLDIGKNHHKQTSFSII